MQAHGYYGQLWLCSCRCSSGISHGIWEQGIGRAFCVINCYINYNKRTWGTVHGQGILANGGGAQSTTHSLAKNLHEKLIPSAAAVDANSDLWRQWWNAIQIEFTLPSLIGIIIGIHESAPRLQANVAHRVKHNLNDLKRYPSMRQMGQLYLLK